MIPITKNVLVVDEQGNEIGATYPKRAKGLVKNGRARFIDDNKICLACPPENILEDKQMETNNKTLNMEYILNRIDKILEENEHISNAIESINNMQINDSINGGFGEQARAEAIKGAVMARETTNQHIIKILDKMYEDQKQQ